VTTCVVCVCGVKVYVCGVVCVGHWGLNGNGQINLCRHTPRSAAVPCHQPPWAAIRFRPALLRRSSKQVPCPPATARSWALSLSSWSQHAWPPGAVCNLPMLGKHACLPVWLVVFCHGSIGKGGSHIDMLLATPLGRTRTVLGECHWFGHGQSNQTHLTCHIESAAGPLVATIRAAQSRSCHRVHNLY